MSVLSLGRLGGKRPQLADYEEEARNLGYEPESRVCASLGNAGSCAKD